MLQPRSLTLRVELCVVPRSLTLRVELCFAPRRLTLRVELCVAPRRLTLRVELCVTLRSLTLRVELCVVPCRAIEFSEGRRILARWRAEQASLRTLLKVVPQSGLVHGRHH